MTTIELLQLKADSLLDKLRNESDETNITQIQSDFIVVRKEILQIETFKK